MKLRRREDGWWIEDTPEGVDGPIGPYDTRGEASEDRRGIQALLDNEDRRGFVTTTRKA